MQKQKHTFRAWTIATVVGYSVHLLDVELQLDDRSDSATSASRRCPERHFQTLSLTDLLRTWTF